MITKEMCLGSIINFCDNDIVWKETRLVTHKKGADYSRVDLNGKYHSFKIIGETKAGVIAMNDIKKLMSSINTERNEKHDLTLVLPNKATYIEVIRQQQYDYVDPIDVWLINPDASITQLDNEGEIEGGFRGEGE